MKVCLIADEFFSWGVYGGFGAFTRKLAGELVKHGVKVEVFVHKISQEQKPVGETEFIDGAKVTTLPRNPLTKVHRKEFYKTDAQFIHSQCGLYDTSLFFGRNPKAKKIVTVQDLRTKADLKIIGSTKKKSLLRRVWANHVHRSFEKALEKADVIACQAFLLKPKIREIYHVKKPIRYLPNFVNVSSSKFKKTSSPSVVWLGRLDTIKQPELCFNLARQMPHVTFNILGEAHDKLWQQHLLETYGSIKNLHFHGFNTGELKEKILSESWILINTSRYECLPVSFLEALAHKCALLSTRNPDNYTRAFGAYTHANIKSLIQGLNYLLEKNRWRILGDIGYDHIREVHSTEKGVAAHLQLYGELTA